jgi:hypothetical protein
MCRWEGARQGRGCSSESTIVRWAAKTFLEKRLVIILEVILNASARLWLIFID